MVAYLANNFIKNIYNSIIKRQIIQFLNGAKDIQAKMKIYKSPTAHKNMLKTLVIRKCKSTPQKFHFTPTRLNYNNKKPKIIMNVDEAGEKLEPPYILVGTQNGAYNFGKQSGSSSKD
jgi:hypothetical protein